MNWIAVGKTAATLLGFCIGVALIVQFPVLVLVPLFGVMGLFLYCVYDY